MAGNKLGGKSKYVYVSDDTAAVYILRRDTDLAVVGTGDGTAAPTAADGYTPPAGVVICPPPKGFRPRYVRIIDRADGATKELICFNPTSDLYNSSSTKTVTIDTVAFETTGRVGEKQTF